MGKFNFKDGSDFEKVKSDAEACYSSLGFIYCPYFSEKISFNAKGLKHLKFKEEGKARSRKDQYARLKLISLAPRVLELSKTVQGIWETKKFEIQKTHSRWEKVLKNVTFYEFIAVLDNIRLKVIVKQVYGGEKHFWSVIPFWKIDKENSKRILHSGNPEED
ncbi:MAG: hypothetical protein ABIF06_00755 [bacterium]